MDFKEDFILCFLKTFMHLSFKCILKVVLETEVDGADKSCVDYKEELEI